MKTLPDLDKCLVVFDEGHHLPAVALDQFGSHMDLEQPALAGSTPKTLQDVAGKLLLSLPRMCKPPAATSRPTWTALARMALDTVTSAAHQAQCIAAGQGWPFRFSQGLLPGGLGGPRHEIEHWPVH